MARDDSAPEELTDYTRRRDLARTPEPSGTSEASDGCGFVIQHHRSSTDHYDFRLEVDGVLKSWAVPKGLSTDPRDKRLAVPTEDHPLEYATFEGIIPRDEYGGGTVLVWDRGVYENRTRSKDRDLSMADGVEAGHVSFLLHGHKLSGGYALNRFRTGADEAWLLVKERDGYSDARRKPVRTQPKSVQTGRDLDEIVTNRD